MKKVHQGLQFYDKMRDDFLGGKSVRTIALENGLEATEVLDFLRWLSREHDIERAIRTDQLLAKLMEAANAVAAQYRDHMKDRSFEYAAAARKELNEVMETYKELAGLNQAWIEHKRKIPQGGRPSQARAAREVGQEPPREPTGGLERALERVREPDNGTPRARAGEARGPERSRAAALEENPFD
ncbi:MAG TPA: hypothetical protein VIE88_00015 [Vicinamibacteria bacterium]|jgi:hypothetical protein